MQYATIETSLDPVAEQTWNAITVAAPTPQGHIDMPYVFDWDTNTSYSVSAGPVSLPLGRKVTAGAVCHNDSPIDITVLITSELIDPDGMARGRYEFSRTLVAQVGGVTTTTDYVTLDKPGTWKLHVKMEA